MSAGNYQNFAALVDLNEKEEREFYALRDQMELKCKKRQL